MVGKDVDVVEIVADFGEDDSNEEGKHEKEHAFEGGVAPVEGEAHVLELGKHACEVGDDFGDAADDNAEKQGVVVKAEDADADDEPDDDADFCGGVAECGEEELFIAIQEDVGCVADGEKEEGRGHELEANAQELVCLWFILFGPGGEEPDIEVGEAGDGGAYNQQKKGLEGECYVGELPGCLFILLLLLFHEDGEEGGGDEFFADVEESVDDTSIGDDNNGFVDGGVQILSGDFRLDEPRELKEDVRQPDEGAGFEDAVGKACLLVFRSFHDDDSFVIGD